MKDFVSIYLHTVQLLYNMIPLAECLGDDPYLKQFKQGKLMYDQYKAMVERTWVDLLRRATIQRITTHLPYQRNMINVSIRRVKA